MNVIRRRQENVMNFSNVKIASCTFAFDFSTRKKSFCSTENTNKVINTQQSAAVNFNIQSKLYSSLQLIKFSLITFSTTQHHNLSIN